ncbi:hypothetical protein CEXT_748011 [Caerostris extrusa]|uniref:Uncharacterized protein n=1 Tax=Caerostris extrusa TaxID=172846 RepID=A0AAV4TA78_CAEEX|nr:hypothetical protein CEXT_748011 [Caerostris extrusa]
MLAKGRTLPPTSSARNPRRFFRSMHSAEVLFHCRVPSSSLPRKTIGIEGNERAEQTIGLKGTKERNRCAERVLSIWERGNFRRSSTFLENPLSYSAISSAYLGCDEGPYHLPLLPEIPNSSFAAYIQQRFSFTAEFPFLLFRGRQLDWRERKGGTGNREEFSNFGKSEFPSVLNMFGESAELFSILECLVKVQV